MRRSTLATALVAVFLSYLGTPAAVKTKTGGFAETDLVANKTPLTDKKTQHSRTTRRQYLLGF
jgi:hypothetical protein